MTLEFNQIVDQVYKMGAMLEKLDFDLTFLYDKAYEVCQQSGDNADVWRRIQWVRQSTISGYRGATPLDIDGAEPVNAVFDEPDTLPPVQMIACDGSQIYPNEQAPVHFYLINIGLYIYHHGIEATPEQYTFPDLRFHRAHVHDRYGRIVSNRTVDDRRTQEEMSRLARTAWERRTPDMATIALYDNRLMYLPSNDADDTTQSMDNFFRSLEMIRNSGSILGGYIDNPHRSKRFIQLLFLMTIQSEEELHEKQNQLARCGEFEGLRDRDFFNWYLQAGQRSAVMIQNSPQNKEYRDRDRDLEIAFFYLKVYSTQEERVVRVDIPVWVAKNKWMVDYLHAHLIHQCKLQGRNPYPYALTRADELAYVGARDSKKLEELIAVQVRRVVKQLVRWTISAKMQGKLLARGDYRRYWSAMGQEMIDDR
jgi:hypothetical protein